MDPVGLPSFKIEFFLLVEFRELLSVRLDGKDTHCNAHSVSIIGSGTYA